ncbi:MAG: glycosyltransferase family protein [Parcubacteria group bacterium]|nr:glycosyltransferase family protein [Parcubacteria group bacterium]
MNTDIFLQARLGSTRLPGKVLMRICGKSVFELIIERLRRVPGIRQIILVTGSQEKNDILAREANRLGTPCFFGSEDNLLDRFYQAGREFGPDTIVRVTGDCPLIDPQLVAEGMRLFREKRCDILTNARIRSYPDGLDFEIFASSALERAWVKKEGKGENPVTPLLEDTDLKAEDMVRTPSLAHIRITLDYPEDIEVIKEIYENFYENNPQFSLQDIVRFLSSRPSLMRMNKQHNLYL